MRAQEESDRRARGTGEKPPPSPGICEGLLGDTTQHQKAEEKAKDKENETEKETETHKSVLPITFKSKQRGPGETD